MWKRFVRWWRSVWGGALDSVEDPEKILQQNIRDMEAQVPVMNENIAMVKANLTLQKNAMAKYKAKAEELKSKIKATLQGGRRDLALNYATSLEQIQKDIANVEGQLSMSQKAYDKALKVKEAFLKEKERKKQEAMRAINTAKQAEWQKKVADAMESFEVAGIDQTHDEMIRKIEEEAALNEARMEMAMDTVDVAGLDVEQQAQEIQANELLKQFELEMGLISPEGAAEAEKTIGPKETEEVVEKTLGPKEKVSES